MNDEKSIRRLLAAQGQEHLLAFWSELNPDQRAALAADIGLIDFELIKRMRREANASADPVDPSRFEAPESLPAVADADYQSTYARARALGAQMIEGGRVAAMVVAGGQATRLGYDAPKGAFPIAPVSGKSLFQLFAEAILATQHRYSCRVPWYVMTSTVNHEMTREFFERHNLFGLPAEDVLFFRQGMIPAVDEQGKVLLEERHRAALSPNGHGGSLTALAATGMLDDMTRREIDYISYFQVDNPLVQPVDPLFIGLHALQRSEMSSLTIGKADDDERVGHFVSVDGKLRVVEYTDFPPALTRLRNADGTRKHDLANIAVHVLNLEFVQRIVGDRQAVALPWHYVKKKVPYVDPTTGKAVSPEAPNAVKAEMFVFDALAFAQRPMLLRTTRGERFSPVKNAEGIDSIATARRDMVRRAAAWLSACGVTVPRKADGEPDCLVEISPLVALDVEMLREHPRCPRHITPGARLLIE